MHSKSFSVHPLSGILGAEVKGVDLSVPPPPALSASLAGSMSHYGVLFLRSVPVTAEGMEGLMRSFGAHRRSFLVTTGAASPRGAAECPHPEDCIALMTEPCGNKPSSRIALFHVEGLPSCGAESIWSSRAGAYDALSPAMRAYLDPLHLLPSAPGASLRPLVAAHPLTGRKHLAVGAHCEGQILGVPLEEGDLVLELARNLLSAPENQIRISWEPGMVALWDCRLAQHYAVGGYGEPGWRLRCICASGAN